MLNTCVCVCAGTQYCFFPVVLSLTVRLITHPALHVSHTLCSGVRHNFTNFAGFQMVLNSSFFHFIYIIVGVCRYVREPIERCSLVFMVSIYKLLGLHVMLNIMFIESHKYFIAPTFANSHHFALTTMRTERHRQSGLKFNFNWLTIDWMHYMFLSVYSFLFLYSTTSFNDQFYTQTTKASPFNFVAGNGWAPFLSMGFIRLSVFFLCWIFIVTMQILAAHT